MKKLITGFEVGALMYCPANNHKSITNSIITEKLTKPFSLAFCLEDTIPDNMVAKAELNLYQTLNLLLETSKKEQFYLPLIFIRIRSPKHLLAMANMYNTFSEIVTGFILPKFYINNCAEYISTIKKINAEINSDYYYMPTLESNQMIDLTSRYQNLYSIKKQLKTLHPQILNIRVGGNDLSHAFGVRRSVNHTIYDIKPVERILTDILTIFSDEYIVAGPVWEYYSGPRWDSGLQREAELDLLNGFIGKTVIHPKQIAVVNAVLQVSQEDYADAYNILHWDENCEQLVLGNETSTRMNEYNTHFNWAKKIIALGNVYGIKTISDDI